MHINYTDGSGGLIDQEVHSAKGLKDNSFTICAVCTPVEDEVSDLDDMDEDLPSIDENGI